MAPKYRDIRSRSGVLGSSRRSWTRICTVKHRGGDGGVNAVDRLESWSERERLETQRARLLAMAEAVQATNYFYREKLRAAGITTARAVIEAWSSVPFTTKAE